MPRSTRQSVGAVPQAPEAVSAPQDVAVVASPQRAPIIKPETSMGALVAGLSQLEPALNQYVQREQKKYEDSEFARGQRERMEDKEVDFALLPEQSPAYQRGYMKMHGLVSGSDAAREMASLYEQNKTTPGFNPERLMDEYTSKQIEGMSDPDAFGAFMPTLLKAKQAIRDDWAKLQIDNVRKDTDAQLQARARDLVSEKFSQEDLAVLDASQLRHAKYQEYVEHGLQLGRTRPEMAATFANALITRALETHDESLLNVATLRDKSGIALVDNPEIGARIVKAREAVQKLAKQDVIDRTVGARTDVRLGLDELLRTDPFNPALDTQNLLRHQGPFGIFDAKDGSDVAAYAAKVAEARAKQSDLRQLNADLDGPYSRIAAARPEAKPLIAARYGKVWDAWEQALQQGDPKATDKFIATNLGFHQQWGVADERLKSLLSHINTAPDKDGKPSADFVRAYQVYEAIQRSPNKDLLWDITDERSRTLLKYFKSQIDSGKTQNAAFAMAKELNTPEAQERLRALATPDERAKARSEIESALKGGNWLTFGMTGRAPNKDAFIAQMTDVWEQKLMILGDRKAALKQTLEEVEGRFARDANDNLVVRPDATLLGNVGGDRQSFEKGLEAYTMDLADTLKKEGKITGAPEDFNLVRKGQGDSYVVMLHGAPAGVVSLEEIIQRGRARDIAADPQHVVSLSGLAQKITKGQLTDEEAHARWADITQLHQIGRIDSRVFDRLGAQRKTYVRKLQTDADHAARTLTKDGLGGMQPGSILQEPGGLPGPAPVQPGGKNLSTAAYALEALQHDDLTFALTAQAEGFKTGVYEDPSRGKNIGLGFSITSRSRPEVASMLRRAGVPSGDVEAVLAGRMQVEPKVVQRLHQIAVPEYRRKAVAAIGGEEQWARLKPEAQAVLTDMAWATGSPEQFKQVIEAMKKGDYAAASSALSLKYTARNGERRDDTRRVELWRVMLSGREAFAQYLKQQTSIN